jgi:mycobactin lysine-N-oxygenase
MYTDPAVWLRLPERQRRAFIRRTDRGVFSVSLQSVLDQADRVHTVLGRVRQIHPVDDGVEIEIDDGHETNLVRYDLVVTAIGFDALWWLPLLDAAAHAALAQAVGASGDVGTRDLERSIGFSLAVANLTPALHLPVLAGLAQGPGFPNLSCLGLLSDRILQPCLNRESKLPYEYSASDI